MTIDPRARYAPAFPTEPANLTRIPIEEARPDPDTDPDEHDNDPASHPDVADLRAARCHTCGHVARHLAAIDTWNFYGDHEGPTWTEACRAGVTAWTHTDGTTDLLRDGIPFRTVPAPPEGDTEPVTTILTHPDGTHTALPGALACCTSIIGPPCQHVTGPPPGPNTLTPDMARLAADACLQHRDTLADVSDAPDHVLDLLTAASHRLTRHAADLDRQTLTTPT